MECKMESRIGAVAGLCIGLVFSKKEVNLCQSMFLPTTHSMVDTGDKNEFPLQGGGVLP